MFARGSFAYLATALVLVGAAALTALLTSSPSLWVLAGILAAAGLFVAWFFRDPERSVAEGVASPADGKVLHVEREKLTIFMTPLDVHVNRAPLAGRVTSLEYHQGSHVPAFKKESDRNERLQLDLSTSKGPVQVRLIAGTVARRIHPYLEPGDEVKKGDRIGLIAFGSRCELILPPDRFEFIVRPGQWVKAGSTPVAKEVPQ